MSWIVRWSFPAERSLLRLHWREASRVDAAVQRFAATGAGDVFRLASDDGITVRLRVGPHGIRMTYDRFDGVITVWSVYTIPPFEPR